jgi:hypothetical protein
VGLCQVAVHPTLAGQRGHTPAGAFTATALADKLPRRAWMRLRTGHGTKGDRHYDWAVIDVLPDDTPGGHPRAGTARC